MRMTLLRSPNPAEKADLSLSACSTGCNIERLSYSGQPGSLLVYALNNSVNTDARLSRANLLRSVLPVFYFVQAAVTGENKCKN